MPCHKINEDIKFIETFTTQDIVSVGNTLKQNADSAVNGWSTMQISIRSSWRIMMHKSDYPY